MKRILLSIFTLFILLSTTAVFALDTSDALYTGVIRITNNSTAATNVSVPFTANTTVYLNAGYINASANNTAITSSSGAEVAYMPGYNGSAPWVIDVPAIGANSIQNDTLFMGGTTDMDAKLRYFPDTGGMTVVDHASLELGGNFTIEQSGYIDTDSGTNKNLVSKQAAFKTTITDSGNITARIMASAANTTRRPDGVGDETNIASEQPGATAHWDAVSDENDATYVYTVAAAYERDLYELFDLAFPGADVNSVTVYFRIQSNNAVMNCTPHFKIGGVVYSGTEQTQGNTWDTKSEVFTTSPATSLPWTIAEINAMQLGISLRYPGGGSQARCAELYVIVNYSDVTASVSATGITSGERIVAVSGEPGVWTSRTSAADNQWFSVAWSPSLSLFAAVSGSGASNRVMTSPDGINWTSRTSAADNSWRGIAWSPELGLFAAVSRTGASNRVMTSPDGINWTSRVNPADLDWRGIVWSPSLNLFAVVGSSGTGNRVMTSPDGINWTSRTSAADNDWRSVAWSPSLSLFAAVSDNGTGNRVMTSPDGINWTSRTSAADNQWFSVAWSPSLSLFAAVSGSGASNRVMTSPDGINWTSRTSAADNQWFSVAWSPELGLFAAVSDNGTGNRVMTSRSGTGEDVFTISVDNSLEDITLMPSDNVTSNSNNWVFLQNNVMPYMEATSVTINGTLSGSWEWELSDTFTDLSGNGNTATPTFRTTSSDADVSAELVTFSPITEARAPQFTVNVTTAGWITANISQTGNFTTTTNATYPASDVIVAVTTAGNVPIQLLELILAGVFVLALSLFISWIMRTNREGSLIFKILLITSGLGIMIAIGIVDNWILYLFLMISIAIAMAASQRTFTGTGNTGNNMVGFLAMAFVGMTTINRILEGRFIQSTDVDLLRNTLAFQPFEVFGLFTIPVPNVDFLLNGIPALIRWDYSFFGGNAQIFQYLLYSVTAVVSFMLFVLVFGAIYQMFSRGR